jgi:uncharacterized membrane protein (DUF485 family)
MELEGLSAARWRIAIALTLTMLAVYVAFILLVAFNKPLLGRVIVPGLSVGILLGVLVIVVAWVLTWWYIRWANAHDVALRGADTVRGAMRGGGR